MSLKVIIARPTAYLVKHKKTVMRRNRDSPASAELKPADLGEY